MLSHPRFNSGSERVKQKVFIIVFFLPIVFQSALEKLDSELLKYGADDIPDFSSEGIVLTKIQ